MTNLTLVLQKAIEKYSFDVGILDPVETRSGVKDTRKELAGGPARIGQKDGGNMADLARELQEDYGWLTEPFESDTNKDILDFADTYVKEVTKEKGSNTRRLENLMQAIVRNPILRGDYGKNSKFTEKKKGFNRLMIDTGTFFNSIKARIA